MQKAALQQLLQSQGWALLVDSLKAAIRVDRRSALVSAGTLDDMIEKNRIAVRAEVLKSLVDLPKAMLDDVEEELLEIYEEGAE